MKKHGLMGTNATNLPWPWRHNRNTQTTKTQRIYCESLDQNRIVYSLWNIHGWTPSCKYPCLLKVRILRQWVQILLLISWTKYFIKSHCPSSERQGNYLVITCWFHVCRYGDPFIPTQVYNSYLTVFHIKWGWPGCAARWSWCRTSVAWIVCQTIGCVGGGYWLVSTDVLLNLMYSISSCFE